MTDKRNQASSTISSQNNQFSMNVSESLLKTETSNYIKSQINHPGGFKYLEGTLKQKNHSEAEYEQPENQMEIKSTNPYANKEDIYSKMGIYQQEDNDQQFLLLPTSQKNKDPFYSANQQVIKQQFSEQLVSEIEDQVSKLRQRRQAMLKRSQEDDNQQNNMQTLSYKIPELKQIYPAPNIDSVITDIWEKQKPSISEVEQLLEQNKQKLKFYEQFYQQQKNQDNQEEKEEDDEQQSSDKKFIKGKDGKPIYLTNREAQRIVDFKQSSELQVLEGIPDALLKYGQVEQEKQKLIQQRHKLQKKIDNFKQNKQQIKQQIINEEMKKIQDKIDQKKRKYFADYQQKKQEEEEDEEEEELVYEQEQIREEQIAKNKSEKKETYIGVNQDQYSQKFQNYVFEKEVEKFVNLKKQEYDKTDFERFQRAASYQKHQELKDKQMQQQSKGIVIAPKKTAEEKQEEDVNMAQQMLQQEKEEGQYSIEAQKHIQNLLTRIINDKILLNLPKKLKEDDFVLKYVFMQIDKSKANVISRNELFDYLNSKEEIQKYYDICMATLFTDLEKYYTQRVGLLNFNEFTQFMHQQKDISKRNYQQLQQESQLIQQGSKSMAEFGINENALKKCNILAKDDLEATATKDPQTLPYTEGTCILTEKQKDALHIVFNQVDKYNDTIVSRLQLLNAMEEDRVVQKMLSLPAVRVPILNKIFTIQQILNQMKFEYECLNEEKKQQLEYVTWNQFFDGFRKFAIQNIKKDNSYEQHKLTEEEQTYDVDQDILLSLKDVFDMLPRVVGDYIVCADFVLYARKDPMIKHQLHQQVRLRSFETNLAAETLEQVLDRIIGEAEEYVIWEDIEPFFCRRGRSSKFEANNQQQEQEIKMKQQHQEQLQSLLSTTQQQQQSDNLPNKQKQLSFQELTSLEKTKKFQYEPFTDDQVHQIRLDMNKNETIQNKIKINPQTITTPLPFTFEQREQERKQKKVEKKVNYNMEVPPVPFKANDVPITTKIPMFDNIIAKNEERRKQVRMESEKILEQTSKPFSFYYRDKQKQEEKKQMLHEVVEEELFQLKNQKNFKAKEAPPTSKMQLYDQLEQKRQQQSKKRVEQRKLELEEEREKVIKKYCPRILEHEKNYKETLEKKKTQKTYEEETHCSFNPKVNKKLPDYVKDHLEKGSQKQKSEQQESDEKKSGFNFAPPVPKKVNIDYLDEDNKRQKAISEEPAKGVVVKELKDAQKQKKMRPIQEEEKKEDQEEKQDEKPEDANNKEPQITLQELEEKLKNKRHKTREEIQQLNKLREQEKDKEKKEKEEAIKKKDKEQADKIRQQYIEDEKQQKKAQKEFQENLEKKLNNRPMTFEGKTHGSSTLDQYRKKLQENSMKQTEQGDIEPNQDQQEQEEPQQQQQQQAEENQQEPAGNEPEPIDNEPEQLQEDNQNQDEGNNQNEVNDVNDNNE